MKISKNQKILKEQPRLKKRIAKIGGRLWNKIYQYGIWTTHNLIWSQKQIQVLILSIQHIFKKKGKFLLHIFPNHPYTQRSKDTRIGKGKGKIQYMTGHLKQGSLLIEWETWHHQWLIRKKLKNLIKKTISGHYKIKQIENYRS